MARNIDDANLLDDVFMTLVASDPDVGEPFCRTLLSALLQRKIGKVKVYAQSVLPGAGYDLRGVRLDVEVEEQAESGDNEGPDVNVYDIEPHTERDEALPRILRFRQAKIDSRFMKRGDNDFSHLPNLYVIMLLNFDPFGKDYMMYTFRNRCEEEPDISYDDGLRFIYFNTKGRKGGSQSIRNVLNYIQDSHTKTAVDDTTKELDEYVCDVRQNPERRGKYMTVGDLMDRKWKQGHEHHLVKQVCVKLRKNKTPDEISEDLEDNIDHINTICTAAAPFAPDYDPEKVWESMHA